jgi:hypothetical protein
LGFRSRGSMSPRVSSESPSAESLSFKSPTKKSQLNRDERVSKGTDPSSERNSSDLTSQGHDADSAPLTPGHSSDSGRSLDHVAWPSIADNRDSSVGEPETVGIDHTVTVAKPVPLPSADEEQSNIRQAVFGSDVDEISQPIQLQNGVVGQASTKSKKSPFGQPDPGESRPGDAKTVSKPVKGADASSVPLWSDRTTSRNAVHPAAVSGTAPKPSVRQTSQSDLSPNRSKSGSTGVLPALPWQSELDQLIARVELELAQSKPDSDADSQSDYLRKQAHLRLLYLMAQRQEEAMTAIPGVEAFQQEYWQQMIWAMSNSFDTVQFPDPGERAAQIVPPLSSALRQAREQAALSIKNMTFCRKISYFGNYERFPRNDFTAGHEVLLYTEIENFVSAPTADGEFRTSLKSIIEITDSQGKLVWTKGFPSTEDFCRNPRRDYFHNYQFYIPEDLSTGTYTLKLTIVDELSKKRASNSLNFVHVPDGPGDPSYSVHPTGADFF